MSLSHLRQLKVDVKKSFGENYLPLEGLSLNFMLDHLGPLNLLDGDAVEDFVYDLTKPQSCSFVELLGSYKPYATSVKAKAQYFVSFAYTASFGELLTALKRFKEKAGEDDIYVWMSVFAINIDFNRGPVQLATTQWFEETFTKLVPVIGKTLFTLSPWTQPIALDRLWCVTELYLTVKNNCELHIILSERDEESFASELLRNVQGLVTYISNVKVENAEVGRLQDQDLTLHQKMNIENTREKLMNYFRTIPGGHDAVNDQIRQQLRLWFAQTSDRTLQQNRRVYETEPEAFCELLNAVGLLYQEQGMLETAETHLNELLQLARTRLGSKHPALAKYLNNLAELLRAKGKLEEAEPLYRQALAIDRNTFGLEYTDVTLGRNNVPQLLNDQEQPEKTGALFKLPGEVKETVFKDAHPSVATGLNNLAQLLQSQGRLSEAEPLMREALAISKKALGPEHPTVAIRLNNIAQLMKAQGKSEEGEAPMREALAIFKKVLGEEHPNVATLLNNIAGLLSDQGKLEEAERLYRQALEIDKKAYGSEHPTIAIRLNNIAELLRAKGKLDEAEPHYRQALAIDKSMYGEEHPAVATVLNNLAHLLSDQGKLDEALELYHQALEIKTKYLGKGHPSLALQLNNIALLLWEKDNKSPEAERLGKMALAFAEEALGKDHPKTRQYRSDWG